jgi:transcription elongation GreA/GreB family factor
MEEKAMTNSNQFESIVKHLLEVEESIEDLVTSLSSSIEERTELSELMKTYIQGVEDILRNKEQINYAQFPTVIIGCRVRMEEVGSGELVEYRIVPVFLR